MELFDLLWSSRFVTEMLLACFLVALPHKKRECFGIRATLFCLAVEGISLLVMNSGGAQAVWTDPVYTTVSCLIYMGVFFALALAFFLLLCPVAFREALYCTALSMTVQHISSALVLLLTALIPGEGDLMDATLWLVTIVVPYVAVYFWCILPICEKGAYQFNVLNLTSATLLIFLCQRLSVPLPRGWTSPGRSRCSSSARCTRSSAAAFSCGSRSARRRPSASSTSWIFRTISATSAMSSPSRPTGRWS
ncbi:MAG: hypothetical protein LIO51_00875 [Clostridiales bacterium]|nr:hypothetical protein [Clostridiales bacterium]